MLSAPLTRAHATDTSAHSSINASEVSGLFAPSTHNLGSLLDPSLPTSLTRHYTSLQEHADQITGIETAGKDEGLTPRQVNRREGFSWGQRPSFEDGRRHSRNPMPIEQERPESPPPLEEIIRRTTIEDADQLQNIKLRHMDSMESQASGTFHPTSSIHTSTETSESYVRDHRRSSIAAFAKGIVQHVPNLRMLHSPEGIEDQQRRDSGDGTTMKLHKKDRVLSFAPLPPFKTKDSFEKVSKPSVVIEEPSTPVHTPSPPLNNASTLSSRQSPTTKGGLRDRRKVNLDLSMPTEMIDLPARGRPHIDLKGSLGAPRQRSPKTPWVRNEQPNWEPAMMTKSAPILEEDYIRDNKLALSNDNHGGIGLLPDTDTIFSSQTPKVERPPAKVRDRCYISRPKSKRNRSGRSDKSGTSASDSTLAQTPDGSWTPAEERLFREQQAQTKVELQKIANDTKTSRSRRWMWLSKTSSEEAPSPGPTEPLSRRFSINPFRRSNRISDQTSAEVGRNKPLSSVRPGRGAHIPPPPTSLAHIPVPPAFIPPGVHRVPTPPVFDANGEVKGKLADFFFDVQAGGAMNTRTKPKPNTGGYWDSDALLMSLSSDIDQHEDEEEDEGPEGPRSDFMLTPVDFEPNGTPGLTASMNNIQGNNTSYLSVKPPASPSLATTSPMLGHDGWYRIHQSHFPDTPDERTIAALACQEEEERRKFEWLVPEHLPNSPLCPLHSKYKGPSAGLCYWHGRRSGNKIRKGEYDRAGTKAVGKGTGGSSGYRKDDYYAGEVWAVGTPALVGTPTREVKKRRLKSLSSS